MANSAASLLSAMGRGLPGPDAPGATMSAGGTLPSVFGVSDLAQASVAFAGGAMAGYIATHLQVERPMVVADRDLAGAWFAYSIRPQGWSLLAPWDAVAGDYEGADGWIRLHTNAPHHRVAALGVLGVGEDRDAVAKAVRAWGVEDLESALVDAGGAAAAMRTIEQWQAHLQGRAVAAEPLVHHEQGGGAPAQPWPGRPDRPLSGVRVLDLTRVLAGPVGTRLLAGWGAEVLRIDPPEWDEPPIVPEVTVGKRCARLDLRTEAGRARLVELLGSADVFVHGYRPDALERLGLGAEERAAIRPGLVDVSLDAYGWSGPWRTRRGFDSLVQMSTGIAAAGMAVAGAERPFPLPVQAIDQATGYLLAGAAITGLTQRSTDGRGSRWRASLARTAALLLTTGPLPEVTGAPPLRALDGVGPVEKTAWGDARRLPPPVQVEGAPISWTIPARPLGSDEPRWAD